MCNCTLVNVNLATEFRNALRTALEAKSLNVIGYPKLDKYAVVDALVSYDSGMQPITYDFIMFAHDPSLFVQVCKSRKNKRNAVLTACEKVHLFIPGDRAFLCDSLKEAAEKLIDYSEVHW